MGGLLVIIGVLSMIVIHEGAHFVAAKYFDMKATEAFFGFGPTIWSTQRGETEYGVKAFPLGGYVRIVGMNPFEDVPPEDEQRTYRQKPFWQKAIVVLAGITSHFVVAFILFFAIGVGWGDDVLTPTVSAVSPVLITSPSAEDDIPAIQRGDVLVSINGVAPTSWSALVSPLGQDNEVVLERDGELLGFTTTGAVQPTPASLAGVQVGDVLVAIDDLPVADWDGFSDLAQERPGVETRVTVERNGQQVDLTARFAARQVDDESVGFFGVSPTVVREKYSVLGGLGYAGSQLGEATVASVQGLWQMVINVGDIIGAAFGADDSALEEVRPISIIGLAQLGNEEGVGFDFTLGLVAWVNIFIGVLNVVPLYPLDGGHFAVALYEKVVGREADVRKLLPVAAAVFIFILLLGLLGIYFDIVNPLQLPG
jgi:membrane-associated protease RseP (regulator of RpoE activity)